MASLEQRKRAVNVGANEFFGTEDRAVHVALGGEVHDGCGLMLGEDSAHQLAVVDVAVHERVARIVRDRGQVRGISGVRQAVEVDERRGLALQPLQYEVRADEIRLRR